MNFILESWAILFTGYCLVRIAGKKTVAEMSGLELITILSIASTTGHAIIEKGVTKTIFTLCSLVAFLILTQFLSIKFPLIKRIFIGKATPVIKDGQILSHNLKKLRISFDQLEARLREQGIASIKDIKSGSIEITGQLGYELMPHAKTITVGDLEKVVEQLQLIIYKLNHENENDHQPMQRSPQTPHEIVD